MRTQTAQCQDETAAEMTIGGYRVVRLIGRGGMGRVYEVVSHDGRRLALKLFSNAKKNRDFLKKRFCAEARLMSRLSHPNLVVVHDAGVDEASGEPFFTMGLVLGGEGEPATLETLRQKGIVSDTDARRWFAEISGVLAYLSRRGVVHRDVKLENVLVDADGHAHLSDFGVSRIFDEELKGDLDVTTTFVEGESTGTRPVMGTYFYLSPEVRSGAPATPESDRYALGVMFFRLLTGMWYEPGVDVTDMLAPFGRFWRVAIPPLLGVVAGSRASRGRRIAAWVAVFVALGALLGVLIYAVIPFSKPPSAPLSASRHESEWALPQTFTPPRVKSLALDNDGGEMQFCACPAGSFVMSSGQWPNDKPGHKVTITRPFWIGAMPVTARQYRSIKTNRERDMASAAFEAAFPEYDVVYRVWYPEGDEFCRRLDRLYRNLLPEGYVFRLPTEAELEYALLEGGKWPLAFEDVYWDVGATKRLVEAATNAHDVAYRDDIRLIPRKSFNGWGISCGWTDSEQIVLDRVNSAADLKYAAEETDPLRSGTNCLMRQAHDARWIWKPNGTTALVRICIGPDLAKEPNDP